MRLLVILCLLLSVSCGYKVSDGKTSGKLIDATWEGIFWKSCEVDVQYGDGASRIEGYSTTDKDLCDMINNNLGKTALVKYEEVMLPWVNVGTKYNIKSVVVQ